MLFCVLNVVNILQTKCFLLVFKLLSYSHMLANFYNHFIACIRVLETCWWQTAFDLLLWISKRTDLNNVQVNFMYALCPEIERLDLLLSLQIPLSCFGVVVHERFAWGKCSNPSTILQPIAEFFSKKNYKYWMDMEWCLNFILCRI